MGWNITLKSDKPITKEVVADCLKEVPKVWREPHAGWVQSWGWSCAVDVFNPTNNELELHGSYSISGYIAEPFAKMMALLLEKRGHQITIGEIS